MARKPSPKKLSLEQGAAMLQDRYRGRLMPPLDGLAYRFTIWLPVQAKGRPVFSNEHLFILRDILNECFGGFSQSNLQGFPAWTGSWLPSGSHEPVIDHHVHFVVYALQDIEAVECMRRLKWLLEQDHVAAQEVVLIEQVPVQFVEAMELTG